MMMTPGSSKSQLLISEQRRVQADADPIWLALTEKIWWDFDDHDDDHDDRYDHPADNQADAEPIWPAWTAKIWWHHELLLFTITLLIFQKESWLKVSLIKHNVDATADEDDGEGQSLPV